LKENKGNWPKSLRENPAPTQPQVHPRGGHIPSQKNTDYTSSNVGRHVTLSKIVRPLEGENLNGNLIFKKEGVSILYAKGGGHTPKKERAVGNSKKRVLPGRDGRKYCFPSFRGSKVDADRRGKKAVQANHCGKSPLPGGTGTAFRWKGKGKNRTTRQFKASSQTRGKAARGRL